MHDKLVSGLQIPDYEWCIEDCIIDSKLRLVAYKLWIGLNKIELDCIVDCRLDSKFDLIRFY